MNQNPPPERSSADDNYAESLISADLIQHIPEEKRGEFIREIILQVEHYSGIIPHPSIVGRWERIMPGSAERILSLSEKHQERRMEMERTMFAEFINREKLGMGLYFILALVMIIGGIVIILSGYSTARSASAAPSPWGRRRGGGLHIVADGEALEVSEE